MSQLHVNMCKIDITQGKNKGKTCGEANKVCRHRIMTCKVCDKTFNRDTVYYSHVKTCRPIIDQSSAVIRGLESVVAKIDIIEKKIDRIAQEPSVSNYITNNTNHIVASNTNNIQIIISDVGAFKALCDKMGTTEATLFLCDLASKPKTITLFEKVYLEGDPSNYPIANNDGKDFYYRDKDNNIICDAGGQEIAQLGKRLMQNTFLEAANPLLTRFVRQNEGDHDGDDEDYDKFRELQNAACRCKVDKTFPVDLYKRTYNPKHDFFLNP